MLRLFSAFIIVLGTIALAGCQSPCQTCETAPAPMECSTCKTECHQDCKKHHEHHKHQSHHHKAKAQKQTAAQPEAQPAAMQPAAQ